MQSLRKGSLGIGLAIFILLFLATAAIAQSREITSPISGSILININYDGYFFEGNFIEFRMYNGSLIETAWDRLKLINRETRTYIDCSDNFRNIYKKERLYGMKEKLTEILSQYDLERLDNLRSRFIKNKGELGGEKYLLAGPGKWDEAFRRSPQKYFLPNRQFSYVVFFRSFFASVGVLIDLNTKEISFPFGLDELENVVWDKEGQWIAYSTPDKGDSSQSILVIKDIGNKKTLLRKNLGKYVADITWSPDSSMLTLLTYTGRIGLLPWELLALYAGHPFFNSTFYLEVYDLSGKPIYNKRLEGNYKKFSGHSKGRLVWIP
jgi:hypothetical protein